MGASPQLEALKASLVEQLGSLPPSANLSRGLEAIENQQFPVSRNEEWKYSPFTIPKDISFRLCQATTSVSGSYPSAENTNFLVLSFLDGVCQPIDDKLLPAGLRIKPIQDSVAQIQGYEPNIFSSLNEAASHVGGILIEVLPNASIEKTISLEFHFSDSDRAAWVQPHIQVVVGAEASISFAERWDFPAMVPFVANALTKVIVQAGATVKWVSFEKSASGTSIINQTRVSIYEKSVFQHVVVTLGEGFVRNNLEILINGTEGDAHMYGLSVGNKKLHVDHHTFVNHKAENTTSNQLYKGIMGGKSTGVFNGKILVDQAAQKTNAYQSSKNILISPDARVYAKPQLEIFADDVKCSHGATIGQLDEEPIFYLRSRGLDEKTAKLLLIQAFAADVLMKIEDIELQALIRAEVEAAMQQTLPLT